DPESKVLLTMDVGERSAAMAQRVVHQVAQVLASGCAPPVSDRWGQRVYAGLADPLWPLGAAPTTPRQRPRAQAALDAPPAAALCADHQDGAPGTFDPRTPLRRVRYPRSHPTGLSTMRLADQYRIY